MSTTSDAYVASTLSRSVLMEEEYGSCVWIRCRRVTELLSVHSIRRSVAPLTDVERGADERFPRSMTNVAAADAGTTRVLIVDDHRMFVDSLVRLLEDEADLVVVGVASTIAEALRSVRAQHPDVVLLDYRLPDGDAPACIAELRHLAPDARVLVMTGLGDDATLEAAREAGCAGVVTKDRAAQDLVEGLRTVAAGDLIAGAWSPLRRVPGARRPVDPGLTAREREVLEALAAGKSTEDIATSLHISPVTVRNHVQRILAKLDARSRLEAVALGIRAGIIAPPPSRRPPGS